MKYNENIINEYGTFSEMTGESPIPAKPIPSEDDYKTGNFQRVFAQKINDNKLVEISSEQADRLNVDLYRIVTVDWTVSGFRENRMLNGILDYGVGNLNKFEIDRVLKEEDVDLRGLLTNPLEYWRGY